MRQVLPVVPAKHNPFYLYLLLCTFWSVLQYNVRMLFPSIETGTVVNARESENYLPSSRSFSASKQCRYFVGRDIPGTTFFQGQDKSGTTITGSSSRLLRIRFSADLSIYWFPVYHFRCKKFKPLVIWIWNQNIAISTIVGTSSHNMIIGVT